LLIKRWEKPIMEYCRLKWISLLSLLLSVSFCCQAIVIKGKFHQSANYSLVYIYEALGSYYFPIDSVQMIEGEFQFRIPKKLPRGFYKIGVTREMAVKLILGSEDLELEADLENLENQTIIKGSEENNAFHQFEIYNNEIRLLKTQWNSKLKEMYGKVSIEQYRIEIAKLKNRFDSLDDIRNQYYKGFTAEHHELLVGKVAGFLAYEQPSDKFSYWQAEDFNDPELLRGDMIQEKTVIYFQRILPRSLNYWNNGVNKTLRLTPAESTARELVYQAIIEFYKTSAPDNVLKIAQRYKAEYPDSPIMAATLATLPKGPPEIGELAPDIVLEDQNGNTRALSSLRGQIVLIDFWASWCKPCRLENPNIVKTYKKYSTHGFTVFGVSLDVEREKWLKAIEKDGLVWHHVSDLNGWKSKGAAIYGVKAIPSSFLIDKEGKVMAINLRGEKLGKKLDIIFDKQNTHGGRVKK